MPRLLQGDVAIKKAYELGVPKRRPDYSQRH